MIQYTITDQDTDISILQILQRNPNGVEFIEKSDNAILFDLYQNKSAITSIGALKWSNDIKAFKINYIGKKILKQEKDTNIIKICSIIGAGAGVLALVFGIWERIKTYFG
jgi:hypothetical protein